MDTHPLTTFRTREKLSPKQLADLLGVSRPTITRWENWTRKPDVQKLPEIEEKTGVAREALRPDLAAVLRAAE